MDLEDFADSEVAVAVAAVSLLLSPAARNLVRDGVTFALAQVMRASAALGPSPIPRNWLPDDEGLEDIVAQPAPASRKPSPRRSA
jgi:hypothetical protein